MKQVKLLFAGDFASHDRCESMLKTKDYASIFQRVRNTIQDADYSVVNLESPITRPDFKAIKKVGPSIKAPSEIADAIVYAGFKMAALANNHMNDYGADGVLYTLKRCSDVGLDCIGAGNNLSEAAETIYKNINGQRFAFINCCEHEFSIADEKTPGCNPLNPIEQFNAINEAKSKADHIVVIVHGGIEMYQLPTPRMQKTYRFFIDAGADLVVNHHQHCFSGYEFYREGLIVYGLGNFCFDWQTRKNRIWNEGYMAEIVFNGNEKMIHLHPYKQGTDEEVTVTPMDRVSKESFDNEIKLLNDIIANPKALQDSYNNFMTSTNTEFRAILSLYSSRLTTALCRRGYLPALYGDYQLRRILLNISCESHIERLIHYIKTRLK